MYPIQAQYSARWTIHGCIHAEDFPCFHSCSPPFSCIMLPCIHEQTINSPFFPFLKNLHFKPLENQCSLAQTVSCIWKGNCTLCLNKRNPPPPTAFLPWCFVSERSCSCWESPPPNCLALFTPMNFFFNNKKIRSEQHCSAVSIVLCNCCDPLWNLWLCLPPSLCVLVCLFVVLFCFVLDRYYRTHQLYNKMAGYECISSVLEISSSCFIIAAFCYCQNLRGGV